MSEAQIQPKSRYKIAVVGTGIAGMSAAWLLNQGHDITVYEKEPRIGGHSNTVEASLSSGKLPVDTGFIVYNERNYPNLTALFAHLGVDTDASDMSFAASVDGGGLEYSGSDINGLIGQRSNVLRPRFWRMVRDLLHFYRNAPAFLNEPDDGMSLGDYLDRHGYSDAFVSDHLLPIGAAIWSTSALEMRAYPAKAFIRFFVSHGLFELVDRPQWRTVTGGSRRYVEKLTEPYRDRIRFDAATKIMRHPDHVEIHDSRGQVERFDAIVLASHADESLRLLGDADDRERSLLGPWRYTKNRAVLHTDASLMPKRRNIWSSWNFLEESRVQADAQICVTYWMNRLQSLESSKDFFVTLNPNHEPPSDSILYETEYDHPFFDTAALETQSRLWSLQGHRRTWYCGSYFGYGFHEDALQSGLAAAEQLGGLRRPWQVADENGRIHVGMIERAAAE